MKTPQALRIGVVCDAFIDWAGGIDFIRGISLALLAQPDRAVELHLLIPDRGMHHNLAQIKKRIQSIRAVLTGRRPAAAAGAQRGPEMMLRDALGSRQDDVKYYHFSRGRNALERISPKLKLDVLIPCLKPLGRDFPIPWVGYVYDFQHRYLQHLFSVSEMERRDAAFCQMLEQAQAIIVNAQAVKHDIEKFVPGCRAEVFALPYSAAPEPDWLDRDYNAAEKYRVGDKYFIICNQFWVHKCHDVAFEAFRQIASTYPDVNLVCTGAANDYRSADYYASLNEGLAAWGGQERVKMLGLIPKRDQIELVKNALAVVQPTLFEGGPGGGAVYDAVSVGTPSIVSDIPVNREIEAYVTHYFIANDSQSLAAAMRTMCATEIERAARGELIATGEERRIAFGRVLLEAIGWVIDATNK